MKNPLIGRGWRFPILPDESGTLRYADGEDNIAQSLEVLLMTSLGERVMRPDFGCDAARLVFAPGTVQYLSLLESTVRESVRDWEPRVELLDLRAESDLADATRVTVSVSYRIRRTNTKQNLVFPFYLGVTGAA